MLDTDDCLARDGRIMDSMLSEHMCEGWLEGYLLTGRHGFFASYEAFIRIVDSMAAQHAKWLKVCNQLSWRQPIASLNFILTSNVWQQDHNGFTHQDPGSWITSLIKKQMLSACISHRMLTAYSLASITVSRARKIQRFLSQPFSVAEQFTGMKGKYVPIKETIRGFKEIIEGKHDDLPESAFLFVGTIDEAVERQTDRRK